MKRNEDFKTRMVKHNFFDPFFLIVVCKHIWLWSELLKTKQKGGSEAVLFVFN